MKIFIDLNHPAHVHYFRNFIQIMKQKGHEFCITARNKEVTQVLLKNYGIDYISRGSGRNNVFAKLLYMVRADFIIFKLAMKFKPDIFLSFGSLYAAHVSSLVGKPHVILDDTEHATFQQWLTNPFTDIILTPTCFLKDFGKKHFRFDGYMELCSLHPAYFKPDPSIFDLLGIKQNERFILLRFVSWNASHDFGQGGFYHADKILFVEKVSKHIRIFISSEGNIPDQLKPYLLKIPPQRIHDVLAYATLFVGEGATMASECAMLGTPAIYVNSLTAGTLEEQEAFGLIYAFRNSQGVIEKTLELLKNPRLKEEFTAHRHKMLEEKIDVTAFLVWFIEQWPGSLKTLKENKTYLDMFKGYA